MDCFQSAVNRNKIFLETWSPGARSMHDTIMVRSRIMAYIIREEVELLQEGQQEQQRPTAEAPQQHANVPREIMAPMVWFQKLNWNTEKRDQILSFSTHKSSIVGTT